MEEQIYQLLLGKLGQTSLSERTIKAKAAQIVKKNTTGEAITEASTLIVEAIEDLQVLNGQYAHDISEAMKNIPPVIKQPKEPQKIEIPKDVLDKLEAFDKFKTEFENSKANSDKLLVREKFVKDVKDSLLKENGLSDNIFLKNALYQIDYEKDLLTNVVDLKSIYDREMSEEVKKGGFIPNYSQSVPAIKSAEDIKKEDAELMSILKAEGKI